MCANPRGCWFPPRGTCESSRTGLWSSGTCGTYTCSVIALNPVGNRYCNCIISWSALLMSAFLMWCVFLLWDLSMVKIKELHLKKCLIYCSLVYRVLMYPRDCVSTCIACFYILIVWLSILPHVFLLAHPCTDVRLLCCSCRCVYSLTMHLISCIDLIVSNGTNYNRALHIGGDLW